MTDDKREWQKKIPEFATKFVHDDDLEVGIEIYGPKEFIDVYESYFHTVSAALLIVKAFPELKDIIRIELRKNQDNIANTIKKILEEKEKHI